MTRQADKQLPPDATPLYARIQAHIRDGIAAGRFRQGQRLPSENERAETFGTTRPTVARALPQLVFERVNARRAGAGTFVAAPPVVAAIEASRVSSFEDALQRSGGSVTYRLISFAGRPASATDAARLGLEPGETVHVLERIRLAGGQPISLEIRVIPPAIGGRMTVAALQSHSMHDMLKELGMRVARVEGVIRAGAATSGQARALDLARGSPLLIRDYVLLDAAGRPLVLGESFYRESFQLQYVVQEAAPPTG